MALLCALLLAATPAAAQPSAELSDLEDEVMCTICGTALGLSQSPAADRQRAFIQRLIDEGRSKQEIKDALVAEYGPEVLATPGASGFDLAAWLVPIVGIGLATIGIGVGVRRWRRAGSGSPDARPLSQADSDRLDADLARYDG